MQEDLALGFSLSEGIIESPAQLLDCEVQRQERGLELQITYSPKILSEDQPGDAGTGE